MSLLPEDTSGIFYDGPNKEYLEKAEKDVAKLLGDMTRAAIPPELQRVLFELGFEGDFWTLGLSVEEALKLDAPSLKRLINEKTGIVQQHTQRKEQETRENNQKFFSELNNVNRILF